MPTTKDSFLHNRNVWIYYALFFSGSLVLVYQASNADIIGDSVNFLCLLFFVNSVLIRRRVHILENALLMTLGYILPLLIRNCIKLSYTEAPSIKDFFKLAMISTSTTLALGFTFSLLGFALFHFTRKLLSMGRSKITVRSLHDDSTN